MQTVNLVPVELDASAINTPGLVEDSQSRQSSSVPSANTSTIDEPIGHAVGKMEKDEKRPLEFVVVPVEPLSR